MKARKNARDLRAEEGRKRKARFTPEPVQAPPPAKPAPPAPALSPEEIAAREAEETRAFLACLEGTQIVPKEDEAPAARRRARPEPVRTINLEDGMPTVEDAVRRLHLGLQTARCDHVGVVRLIHGYGSTGKGGRIRTSVLAELGRMKKRGAIRDYAAGEDFGPFGEDGRRMVSRYPHLARDPDYGRDNRGITMVIL